jgi:hypothetical protein
MKKTLLALAATLSFSYANAQMKLGSNPTTTNADALLEMETTNKGLLLPRVALTSTTVFAPLTAHVAGMAVYNTATAGDVTPGYYFDNGTKWVRVADANAAVSNLYTADGTLTGARTVTMGANNLSFSGTGKIGMGTTSPNTKLQATGALTLTPETVGSFSDILHVTGPSWSFGDNSRLLSWSYNLAGGPGGDGLHFFIPANVKAATTHADATISMYTDNGGNDKVGIATVNPATTLDVNGQISIRGGTPGVGKVLTSDATGVATWQSANAATGSLAGAYNPIGTTNLIMAAGAAEADVPGVTQTFTLTKAATVNVIATGIISNFGLTPAAADIQGSFKIDVDGTNMTAAFASSGNRPGLSAMPTPITLSYNVTLAAGTHTIKLKYKPWNGGANLNLNAFTAGYGGATAIDADALKSRMSILIFNN